MKAGHLLNKIPDPSGGYTQTVKRPFDFFGQTMLGNGLYIEAKLVKSKDIPVRGKSIVFNLNDIERHQYDSLKMYKAHYYLNHCLIMIQVDWSLRDHRMYIFDDIFALELRRDEGKHLTKDELWNMPSIKVESGYFDFSKFTVYDQYTKTVEMGVDRIPVSKYI